MHENDMMLFCEKHWEDPPNIKLKYEMQTTASVAVIINESHTTAKKRIIT